MSVTGKRCRKAPRAALSCSSRLRIRKRTRAAPSPPQRRQSGRRLVCGAMLDRSRRTGPPDAGARSRGVCGGGATDLLRGTLELEAAASEVQDAALHGTPPDRLRKRIEVCAAVFLDFEQTGFTQDAQMFRHVVRRDIESCRNLADVER